MVRVGILALFLTLKEMLWVLTIEHEGSCGFAMYGLCCIGTYCLCIQFVETFFF